jgi:hypothetical protein
LRQMLQLQLAAHSGASGTSIRTARNGMIR